MGERVFYLCFGGLQKARQNTVFFYRFSGLTAQIRKFFRPVRLFVRWANGRFFRPAPGTFLIKNDALDGGRELFVYVFAGFLKPAKTSAFFFRFSGLTAQVVFSTTFQE